MASEVLSKESIVRADNTPAPAHAPDPDPGPARVSVLGPVLVHLKGCVALNSRDVSMK